MRQLIFWGFISLSSTAAAGPAILPAGPVMGAGPNAHNALLQTVAYNPAAVYGSVNRSNDERFRFGFGGAFGLGIEYGDVANFQDDLDRLIDTLDEDISSLQQAETTVDEFNALLPNMGENGYVNATVHATYPMFPVVFQDDVIRGALSLEFSTDAEARLSLLDDPLDFVNGTNNELEYVTNSAAYLKSAIAHRFATAYSRPVWQDPNGNGTLIAGARLNVYRVSLTKQVQALENLQGEDVGDVMEDDYNNNQVDTTSAGLDIGALWLADRYTVGMSITNLNEPTFDFGAIGGSNCAAVADVVDQRNCFVSEYHANQGSIRRNETHTMQAITRIEGAFAILPQWIVGASTELAAYTDFVGNVNQWMTLSTSYTPISRWGWPTRIGYRKNLSGTELSAISFGTSMFGTVNFDLLYGLESTTIDGDDIPRTAAFSLGVQERF